MLNYREKQCLHVCKELKSVVTCESLKEDMIVFLSRFVQVQVEKKIPLQLYLCFCRMSTGARTNYPAHTFCTPIRRTGANPVCARARQCSFHTNTHIQTYMHTPVHSLWCKCAEADGSPLACLKQQLEGEDNTETE